MRFHSSIFRRASCGAVKPLGEMEIAHNNSHTKGEVPFCVENKNLRDITYMNIGKMRTNGPENKKV